MTNGFSSDSFVVAATINGAQWKTSEARSGHQVYSAEFPGVAKPGLLTVTGRVIKVVNTVKDGVAFQEFVTVDEQSFDINVMGEQAPGNVKELTVIQDGVGASIRWSRADYASGYEITRKDRDSGESVILPNPGDTDRMNDVGVKPGGKYTYSIVGLNSKRGRSESPTTKDVDISILQIPKTATSSLGEQEVGFDNSYYVTVSQIATNIKSLNVAVKDKDRPADGWKFVKQGVAVNAAVTNMQIKISGQKSASKYWVTTQGVDVNGNVTPLPAGDTTDLLSADPNVGIGTTGASKGRPTKAQVPRVRVLADGKGLGASWQPTDLGDGYTYTLLRSESPLGTRTTVVEGLVIPGDQNSFNRTYEYPDYSGVGGTRYYYFVQAVNSAGRGDESDAAGTSYTAVFPGGSTSPTPNPTPTPTPGATPTPVATPTAAPTAVSSAPAYGLASGEVLANGNIQLSIPLDFSGRISGGFNVSNTYPNDWEFVFGNQRTLWFGSLVNLMKATKSIVGNVLKLTFAPQFTDQGNMYLTKTGQQPPNSDYWMSVSDLMKNSPTATSGIEYHYVDPSGVDHGVTNDFTVANQFRRHR